MTASVWIFLSREGYFHSRTTEALFMVLRQTIIYNHIKKSAFFAVKSFFKASREREAYISTWVPFFYYIGSTSSALDALNHF